MPKKTLERLRKSTTKPRASDAPPDPALAADRYITDQLKAIYDAVVTEPIPDRLLQLLDRLGGDAEK